MAVRRSRVRSPARRERPDAGKTFTGSFDTPNDATFSYVNNGKPGTDRVSVTSTDTSVPQSEQQVAYVTWTAAPPAPTRLTAALAGGGKRGASVSVPAQTPVTDTATLAGANVATATGTVTYKVYSNAACTKLIASTVKKVTAGKVPPAGAITLRAGKYYWTVAYSGNAANKASAEACGSEVLTVRAKHKNQSS